MMIARRACLFSQLSACTANAFGSCLNPVRHARLSREEILHIRVDPPLRTSLPSYVLNLGSETHSKHVQEVAEEDDKLFSRIELICYAHDKAVLKSYETFLLQAAAELLVDVGEYGELWPPYILWRRTLLRSAHVHKSARVQYETRTYRRRITLHRLTGSTADTYLEYVERNLPEGVGLRVVKQELLPLTKPLSMLFNVKK